MSGALPLDTLLDSLPRFVLVTGKGGVGKTTCAAALALRSAERVARGAAGSRTLLLTTDPAGTLAEAIDAPLGASPSPVEGVAGLDAFRIDARAEREAFLARWRELLVTIVDRGTYLDREDIEGLVDVAFPGADEVFAVLRLAAIARGAEGAAEVPRERVIVDTAPTGHTLRLLALPRTFDAMLRLLETMQDKHRFVVRALTHRYRADAADAFLAELRGELEALRAVLADRTRAAAVVVERDEPVVRAEGARLVRSLGELGIAVAARVMNAVDDTAAAGDATHVVPRLDPPPEGRDGVRRWMRALREAGAPARPATGDWRPVTLSRPTGPARLLPLVRPLTIVGGKGGVGKTTVACALAIAAARAGHATLLVSTDPAPSVGDALALDVPDAEVPVPGVPGLVARQMDAAAAFERLRREYQQRLDEVFAGFLGAGFDAAHDRAILRDLLALAPPGIDELYAMASLGATVEEGRFARLVVDPAPTGHLLRLLEIPALALDWTHRLMRLLLKYREVAGPGDLAEVLLEQARRTRALQALLRDPARAGVVVVALDEPLVRGETARLAAAVRALGVDVTALVWNRSHAAPASGAPALPEGAAAVQVIAPPREPPPVGVEALAAWGAEWRTVPPAHVA